MYEFFMNVLFLTGGVALLALIVVIVAAAIWLVRDMFEE